MEKNDLVYILGKGSRWRNNEIRYSLRSVEKNMPKSRVFIIGECPEFITGVVHIPVKDESDNKLINARRKYLIAASDKRISQNFILMNDDFFILKKIDKVENYIRGTLAEMIKRHPIKGGYYYKSLNETKRILEKVGVEDPWDFEVHAPMVFDKDKLLAILEMIDEGKAYSFRSLYGNLCRLNGTKVIDFKATSMAEFVYQMKRDDKILSINDNLVVQKEFRDWLRRKFKKPSKYETDRGEGCDILPGEMVKNLKYYAAKSFSYLKKTYSKGEIIDGEMMDEIINNPRLKENWELK